MEQKSTSLCNSKANSDIPVDISGFRLGVGEVFVFRNGPEDCSLLSCVVTQGPSKPTVPLQKSYAATFEMTDTVANFRQKPQITHNALDLELKMFIRRSRKLRSTNYNVAQLSLALTHAVK